MAHKILLPDGRKLYSCTDATYKLIERIKIKLLNENQDYWIVIGGGTGEGKSLTAMRLAYTIDQSFNLDKVCFNVDQFEKQLKKTKPGNALVFDELINVAFRRDALTSDTKTFIKLKDTTRSNRNAVICCIPDVALMDKYLPGKIDMYIHVWESRLDYHGKKTTFKGNFAVYPNFKKSRIMNAQRMIMHLTTKNDPYKKTLPEPPYLFTVKGSPAGVGYKEPIWPFDYKEYDHKKHESGKKKEKINKNSIVIKQKKYMARMAKMILEDKEINQTNLSKRLGISRHTLRDYIKKYKEIEENAEI